jgi:periplasmic copper chaperone A
MFAVRLLLVVLLGIVPVTAIAQPAGKIRVDKPWARASAGTTGAVYLTVRNEGDMPDKLVGASTPAAGKAELHTMIMDGNVMRMRGAGAIDVVPHGTVELKPGGLHLMLMELKAPLKQGETFPLTLKFDKAGDVLVNVGVTSIGATGPGPMNQMNHGH